MKKDKRLIVNQIRHKRELRFEETIKKFTRDNTFEESIRVRMLSLSIIIQNKLKFDGLVLIINSKTICAGTTRQIFFIYYSRFFN